MVQQATTRMISRETESIAGNYRLREWAIKNRVTNVVTLRTLTDSDEGLTLETSAFESLYGGQFSLSTQLIKPTYLVILPTDAEPQFIWKLTPLYMTACPKEEIALDFEREQRWM